MRPFSDVTAAAPVQQKHNEARVKAFTRVRPLHGREATRDEPNTSGKWAGRARGTAQAVHRPAPPPGADAPVGGIVKRAFDVTIASTTLILMAPIMILIALLILATTGGPVFFVQQRVGFKRRLFGCLKFRTMVVDAGDRLAAYLAEHPGAAQSWRETQKLRNDPRVTWFGRILRKSSLDELPQLFNVLSGDMSCIGPRPVLQDELARYGEHDADYARAKPGLTGMWQVNGRSNASYAYRVKCDRYYVRRWSVGLDLGILFKTFPAVIKFDETD